MKFEIIQNVQPLYSLGGWLEPDKEWIYTDKAGHTHKWENDKLPTLEEMPAITEFEYCECCDGYEREIEPAYYRCLQCLEIIEPKYKINKGPIYQYGRSEYYIDDQPVTQSEFDEKIKLEYAANANVYIERTNNGL